MGVSDENIRKVGFVEFAFASEMGNVYLLTKRIKFNVLWNFYTSFLRQMYVLETGMRGWVFKICFIKGKGDSIYA